MRHRAKACVKRRGPPVNGGARSFDGKEKGYNYRTIMLTTVTMTLDNEYNVVEIARLNINWSSSRVVAPYVSPLFRDRPYGWSLW